jgi:RNA polymerase sigma factor (sigma-70 family)
VTPPPPAEQFASRIFLGPALRAQPDRRLVTLVREGYETAFEEIVRRYRKPLDRFAASFVGGRSEDVTQDAFSKALLALRGSEAEIELRPWLYRIVRNTALNDLRDRPPSTEELDEVIPGGLSASVEAERREEMTDLMTRLRALPEPQRAAIVMRELEGLSHEEIATSLGLTGGAARQVIYRARQALRDGFGMLIPLPLLRALFDHGAEAAGAGAGGAVAAAGTATAGTAGATLGGLGAGGALKVGLATALVAGSVGAGVALHRNDGGHGDAQAARATLSIPVSDREVAAGSAGQSDALEPESQPVGLGEGRGGGERGDGSSGHGGGGHGSRDGSEGASSGDDDPSGASQGSSGSSQEGSSRHGGRGPGGGDDSGSGEHSGDVHSGGDVSEGSQSGRHGSGGGDSGGSSGSSGGGAVDSSGSGGDGSGGGDDGGPGPSEPVPAATPAPVEEVAPENDGGSEGGDSGSSGRSGDSGSGGGGDGL